MGDTVGVIGTGLVGSAIAELLLAAGLEVAVWDRLPSQMAPLAAKGARLAAGPGALGAECRRVFVSVMTTGDVAALAEDTEGLLSRSTVVEYLLDTTTGDPDETVQLAARLAQRGVHYLDATISGSSQQIRARAGLFMVGGDRAACSACEDLFGAVTDKWVHVGPAGSGSRAKLASNVVLGLNRLALAGGLVFAESLGLEPGAFLDLLKASPAYSTAMDVKGEKMIQGDFEPQSRIRQHLKDVEIILKYASSAGQQLPLSELHLEIMTAAVEAGDGELDNAAVIRELRRRRQDTD
jgi:3-hydroxyisobutyrate dehydrogenase-like beta-hydroxyacid dehydrogenase